MNVIFFWERAVTSLDIDQKTNPYGPLLANAMHELGIEYELGRYSFEREWLDARRNRCEVLHINWLHHFYRAETPLEATELVAHFLDNLYYAKSIGYRIVWTMHNHFPHERPYPDLDLIVQLAVADVADHVIVHCEHARLLAAESFYRSQKVHVIPHGNYIDAYPNVIGRSEAREGFGIDRDAFVFLFLGNARPYKGIENLIEAFRSIRSHNDTLMLMMRTGLSPEYGQQLEEQVKNDPSIHVHTSPFFSRSYFSPFLNASDVAVLPFEGVLTSGSAILAMSFGKPLVVPSLGCLPELLEGSGGELYDPEEPNGLMHAMQKIREVDLDEASQATLAKAESWGWDRIASQIMPLYGFDPNADA